MRTVSDLEHQTTQLARHHSLSSIHSLELPQSHLTATKESQPSS